MTEHRQGCPANGGYGHGVEPCACGADALKPEYPPLPPRACIVTNMGDDLPQRFMLNTRDGVKLMELPPGSTLDLYTADQMHAYATAALAQKDGEIAALKGLLRDAREWVEVGAHYEHDDSDARELMRAIDAALSTPPTPPSAPAETFDAAVSEELLRVSHLEYDSHEICKHFATQLRARLFTSEQA